MIVVTVVGWVAGAVDKARAGVLSVWVLSFAIVWVVGYVAVDGHETWTGWLKGRDGDGDLG